jgi:NTE family protein
VIVAVDISSAPEGNPSGDPLQILLQTFAIMGKSINSWELKEAEVVVRPGLRGVGSGDFTAKRRAIEAGRAAMLAALPRLRQVMEAKSH